MATTTTYNLKQKIEAINTSKNEIKSAIEDKIEASIGESYEILGNIQTYANEIGKIVTPNNQTLPTITENGTYEYNVDTYTGLNNVTVNVNQSVQDKIITENGTYNASEGYIGFGEVTVEVENPPLMTKTITQNGTYKAEDDNIYGYDEVVVDVTGEFLVQVIDYDGTVLKSEMLNEGQVFTLPEETPTHSGLIFQEWSSPVDIEDNSVTVGQSDIIIGATYTTASGLSEFDITLTAVTGLTVTLYMNGTKNWGDGTSDTSNSHTYSDYGDYTISCNGTNITSTQTNRLFGQTSSSNNYYVTNVRLTNVHELNEYSFSYCLSLKTITLSNSITNIYRNCFQDCSALKSIVIPSSVFLVKQSTFLNCISIEYIVLSNNISTIENQAFYGCYSLQRITFSNSLSVIGEVILGNCFSLKTITIPENVNTLGYSICENCYSLKTVIIKNNSLSDDGEMFNGCNSLSNVKILGEITTIPLMIFTQCRSLSNITIPNSVTKIDNGAFQDCFTLKEIILPTNLSNLGNNIFYNCESLSKLKIPKNILNIYSQTFYDCKSIIEYDFSEHTSVPILSNINAFYHINKICKIKVPASLESEWKTATNWSTYANYIVGV